MSKAKDFSGDLQAISETVENDVGAFMKLVRREQSAQKSAKPNPTKLPPLQTEAGEETQPDSVATSSDESPPSAPARSRKKADEAVRKNYTTRLRQETIELLTEATLRQKLKRELPSTAQDIIDAALREWFRRHGYALSG